MINRKFFFDFIRQNVFSKALTQQQVDGTSAILNEWEGTHAYQDDRWLAYMLGTTWWETAQKMWPIEEYGKGKKHKYGQPDSITGKTYYGRGFVQLTWKANYARMTKLLGVDFVSHPELALDVYFATKILFVGMMGGEFTGKSLSDYFTASKEDWVGARRIVNPGEIKSKPAVVTKIAIASRGFYAGLSYTTA